MHSKSIFSNINNIQSLSTVDEEMLLRAYNSYIRSIAEYGLSVYSPSNSKDIARPEKIEDDFTRKIFFRIARSRFVVLRAELVSTSFC